MFKSCKDGVHKYEPRYDMQPPNRIGDYEGCASGLEDTIKALTKKIYVHDICVKCGNIIKAEVNNMTTDSKNNTGDRAVLSAIRAESTRPNNSTLVPTDKLKEMQTRLAELEKLNQELVEALKICVEEAKKLPLDKIGGGWGVRGAIIHEAQQVLQRHANLKKEN